MGRSRLEMRVEEGVLLMREGEATTVGKVATIEGVSKSPQLYAIFQQLVDDGYLEKSVQKHSNGKDMFLFTRTSKQGSRWEAAFESKGY